VDALAEAARTLPGVAVNVLPATLPADLVVAGEPDLLARACAELLRVGAELQKQPHLEVHLSERQGTVFLRLELPPARLAAWYLPRAFEPYSLSAVQRGTSCGLSLFAVQAVVEAHGGTARAARAPGGQVSIELAFPRATGV
jgi:C4-dicarboxylate-specific signal transduction histidine kinase